MVELDFDNIHEDSLIDSLTWSNISHNVENGNYTLEDAKQLFPSHSELIDLVYKGEMRRSRGEL